MSDHPILFIPGPVEVEAELRKIMSTALIGHRSAEFMSLAKDLSVRLQGLFLSEGPGFFDNCPATAIMEAAIRNLVGRRVLHLCCGAFGERWAKISMLCGREAEVIAANWGQPVRVDTLAAKLQDSEPFEAACITHCETSTGLINPLAELAATLRELSPQTLILVDAVTTLGGAELRCAEWGIDLAFAGTQKCLALPPGLAVYALSPRAIERASEMPGRGFLLDFAAAPERFGKGATPATPCVPLVMALARQLERISDEGLQARWQRHLAMRSCTEDWAAQEGFEMFVSRGSRSPTVSAVRYSGRDPDDLIARARLAGFVLAKGYGKLESETFRIGHMGDHSPERLSTLLAALSSPGN